MKVIRQLLIAWMLVAFLVFHGFGQDVKPPPPPRPLPLPTKIITKSVSDENSSGNDDKLKLTRIIKGGRTIKIPPRIPKLDLDWTVFTYNSPEEKAFWDELPDWSGKILVREWNPNPFIRWPDGFRRNEQGEIIKSNSSEGFNGYVKHGKAYCRTIYQFVDGYPVRSKSWSTKGEKWKELNYKEGKQDGLETYWYVNGEKQKETNYKNLERDGPSTSWHVTGQKIAKGNYKDGKEDGLWTLWYKNGQKQKETNYKDGRKHGLETVWDGNGQKKSETNYKDGKEDGLLTSWYEYGQKKSERNYKDGKLHGLSIKWFNKYDPGDRREEYYKDGKLHGLSIAWYKGQKSQQNFKYSQRNYKDGKLDGPETSWFENGQQKQELHYKDGKLSYAKVWMPDGKECPESKVIDGNGTLVTYSLDGKEISRLNFKDGIRQSQSRFRPPRSQPPLKLPDRLRKLPASPEANSSKPSPPPPSKILPSRD